MGLLVPQELSEAQQRQIIDAHTRRILSCCSPLALVLFGSAARGSMTERSDIDIALIFSDIDTLRIARTALHALPPPEQPWPADLLFFTAGSFTDGLDRGGVCELIRKEGALLSGRWP